MLAKHLTSNDIMPLHLDDECNTALVWMDELKVYQLPVVEDGLFIGLVSEKDIYSLRDLNKKIREVKLPFLRIFVYETQHILEIIKNLAINKLTLIPVIDEKEMYMGSIISHELLSQIASLSAIDNPGSILVVEVGQMDYMLSEISRIVESNDAKILCMYITTPPDSSRLEITLKINKMDVQPLIQTFNRFNYVVKASYSEDHEYFDELKDRYDSLMKYLNI